MEVAGKINLIGESKIPPIGFGTWQLADGQEAYEAVKTALLTGYRLIDTASIYGNEASVGRAIKESGLPREQVFLTTKMWHSEHGYDNALRAFDKSLSNLGLDYVDLYLIHWPNSSQRLKTWRAFEKILSSGRAKQVGVSNYTIKHLSEILESSRIVPFVNQVEFHPFIYQDQTKLLEFCRENRIIVEAYSPLARGWHMENAVIKNIAKQSGKSVAQVMLRWAIQHGTVPLPKTTNEERIAENFAVFNFELTAAQMEELNALGTEEHLVWDPNQID